MNLTLKKLHHLPGIVIALFLLGCNYFFDNDCF